LVNLKIYLFLIFNEFRIILPAKVQANPKARLIDRTLLLSENTCCATDPQPKEIKIKIPNVSAKNSLVS